MSSANWAFVTTAAGNSLTASAIEGSFSLSLQGVGSPGSNPGGSYATYVGSAGITSGKIRSLYRFTGLSGAARHGFGLFGMMQGSSPNANGVCYALVLSTTGTAFPITMNPFITKGAIPTAAGTATSGLGNGSNIVINSASEIHSMELEWQYDSLNGVVALFARVGTATDFSDLTSLITVIDTSSIYGSSAGCGVYVTGQDENAFTTVVYDKTQIYKP